MAFKAELLKNRLKEEGKTPDELAVAIKKHQRTVRRWLAGDNPPKAKDMEKIAQFLNCKPQDFDPFFADIGLGEVSIQAHVSAASHNAFEVMRWRYGVSQKQIIELAPVLFAIVAGHALKVPGQDYELNSQARMNGRPSTEMSGDHIDREASRLRRCFGSPSPNPNMETSRNLFDEAICRLSAGAKDYVGTGWYIGAEPGGIPSVSGYVSDTAFLNKITGSDTELVEAIVKGRIRLSTILQQAKEEKDSPSIDDFAKAIRRAHDQGIEKRRKKGLRKFKDWQMFYAELHPKLAKEYEQLVTRHCHEEKWYPEHYTADDRIQSWVNPFQEDRHINEDTLEEYQRLKADGSEEGTASFVFPFEDPVYRRFGELQFHRTQLKKLFEESWS